MYYNYPVYANSVYGSPYVTVAQTPETRDQFIRRYVMEMADEFSLLPNLISAARTVWDESIKTEKK